MWRPKSSKTEPENAPVGPDDDATASAKLPPGWTRKESKSQKGRYYYISPSGKTQWVPPAPTTAASPSPSVTTSSKTSNASSASSSAFASIVVAAAAAAKREKVQIQYNWVHEIEIEFGEGRLGVSLREVRQLDTIPYPQFQAEVDDLPKVNGKAGPAELYNWSVKPPQRLTIGMRITFIDTTSLAGFTYKEVVDKLKRATRPVKLKFADVDQGTMEENPEARQRLEQQAQTALAPKKSKYLEQKQAYTRVLVTSELHTELWSIETKKLDRQQRVLQTKWTTVSKEVDALNTRRVELQKDHDKLLDEKQHFTAMIKQLKAQENHDVGNPEFITANELAKRHAELTDDITKMGSGNKRLRKERVTLQLTLDELENEQSKLGKSDDDDQAKNDDDLFFGIDPTAPPADQLIALRKKMRFMDDELVKEQRKATKVEKEMEQLNRHLTKLSTSSSGRPRNDTRDRDSAKTEHASSSSSSASASTGGSSSAAVGKDSGRSTDRDKPSDVAGLEMRILDLRKKQRAVVDSMSKAARDGDKELARECQKKRKAIKDELARAQDALQALKAATADTREEPSRGADRRKESSTSAAGSRSRHPSSATASASTSGPSKSSSSSTQNGASGGSPPTSSTSATASTSTSTPKEKKVPEKEEKMPTLNGFLDKGPTEWSGRGLIRNMKTMRGARERWCEICEDGKLRYYKRRGDDDVRGEIDLSDASFEVTCEDLQRGKEFVLCTSDQQSHFFTKSTDELQVWVRTLRAANAYLKTKGRIASIASKLDAAERKHGSNNHATPGDDYDEQFYGRATLGF